MHQRAIFHSVSPRGRSTKREVVDLCVCAREREGGVSGSPVFESIVDDGTLGRFGGRQGQCSSGGPLGSVPMSAPSQKSDMDGAWE